MKNRKQILAVGLFIGIMVLIFFPVYEIQAQVGYVPLTTVPGVFEEGQATNPVKLMTGFYGFAIGIGAVLAVVMIMYAGFTYMYQESITGKSDAKNRITNAFLGLLVILGSYIILRTVNADLVNFDLTLPGGSGRLEGIRAAMLKAESRSDAALRRMREAQTTVGILEKEIESFDKQIEDLEKKISENPQDTEEEIAQAELDKQAIEQAKRSRIMKLAEEIYVKMDVLLRSDASESMALTGNVVSIEGARDARITDFKEQREQLVKYYEETQDPSIRKQVETLDVRESIFKTEMDQLKEVGAYRAKGYGGQVWARESKIVERIQKNADETISWLRSNGYGEEADELEEVTADRIALID